MELLCNISKVLRTVLDTWWTLSINIYHQYLSPSISHGASAVLDKTKDIKTGPRTRQSNQKVQIADGKVDWLHTDSISYNSNKQLGFIKDFLTAIISFNSLKNPLKKEQWCITIVLDEIWPWKFLPFLPLTGRVYLETLCWISLALWHALIDRVRWK